MCSPLARNPCRYRQSEKSFTTPVWIRQSGSKNKLRILPFLFTTQQIRCQALINNSFQHAFPCVMQSLCATHAGKYRVFRVCVWHFVPSLIDEYFLQNQSKESGVRHTLTSAAEDSPRKNTGRPKQPRVSCTIVYRYHTKEYPREIGRGIFVVSKLEWVERSLHRGLETIRSSLWSCSALLRRKERSHELWQVRLMFFQMFLTVHHNMLLRATM